MPQIEAYLTAHPSKDYHFFKTQSTLMEFSHRRVSKAYALKNSVKNIRYLQLKLWRLEIRQMIIQCWNQVV